MSDDRVTGSDFRRMISTAVSSLEAEKETINALNVFPVPDGDTGSNMCLTMKAAVDQLSKNGSDDLASASQALSYGSLMGARGNSGVILSQILRGISLGLQDQEDADAVQLAGALTRGVKTAYRAVMKPVEGTILTVAREAAGAAEQAALERGDVDHTLAAALDGARKALDRTPEQLAVLKRAGVVDAGGKGLVCLLEGMLAGWRGEEAVVQDSPVRKTPVAFEITEEMGDITFPYDTELMIRGESLDQGNLTRALEDLGDSIVVVEAGDLTKVHIHTGQPADVLALCLEHGQLDDVVIKNMRQQHSQLESSAGVGPTLPAEPYELQEENDRIQVSLVAVAAGDGFSRLFKEMGADAVVPGGQTMNPSTQEILEAVDGASCNTVFILPNNPNVVLTCRQVDALTDKEVHVIETRDMAQGVAALLPWQPERSPEELLPAMSEALEGIRTGAVTYAVRGAEIDGMTINEGSVLGLENDHIAAMGEQSEEVLIDLIGELLDSDSEIVSIFAGSMIEREVSEALSERLSQLYPDVEIEVVDGGQDHYYYLVSVE